MLAHKAIERQAPAASARLPQPLFRLKGSPTQWEFVVTVAGVFTANAFFPVKAVPEEQAHELFEVVYHALAKWNANGPAAYDDCRQFFHRGFEGLRSGEYKRKPELLIGDLVGAWVSWNLFGHAPWDDEDERRFVRTVGAVLIHSMAGWWTARFQERGQGLPAERAT